MPKTTDTMTLPTTITGSQSPLIIVDGVITDNTLADIGSLDVESIEIVKGAAAASLYGSRASNGVDAITHDEPAITARSAATRSGEELTSSGRRVRSFTRPRVWNEFASGRPSAFETSRPTRPESQ